MKNVSFRLLKKDKIFWLLLLFTYIILPFFDMKRIGVVDTFGELIFRMLAHQIFVVFLILFAVKRAINEKIFALQKTLLVIYTNDLRKTMIDTMKCTMISHLCFYNIGQVLFQLSCFLFTNKIYNIPLLFILYINVEIITIILSIFCLFLIFQKDTIVYFVYYISIIILLVINHFYITIPYTIKMVDSLIGFRWDIFLIRILIMIVSIFTFTKALKKYTEIFFQQ